MWRSFPASPPALMPSVDPVFPRPSADLPMSPPIIRGPFRASVLCAPARRAPSPASLGPYDASGDRQWKFPPHEVLDKLMDFFTARLRNHFMSQGVDTPLVDAALGAGATDVRDCGARLAALTAFSREEGYAAAVQTFKRVANILRKQAAAQGEGVPDHWDPSLLREAPEQALAATLETLLPRLDALWAAGDHKALLDCLGEVRPAVDAFFDGVMVMAEDADLRRNRLAMLRALGSRFARLADFAALQQ